MLVKNEPSYSPDMVYSQSVPLLIGYNTDLEKWNNYPVSINRVGKEVIYPSGGGVGICRG